MNWYMEIRELGLLSSMPHGVDIVKDSLQNGLLLPQVWKEKSKLPRLMLLRTKNSLKDLESEDIQRLNSSNPAKKTIHQLLTTKEADSSETWLTGHKSKSQTWKSSNIFNWPHNRSMTNTVKAETCVSFHSYQALWTQPQNNAKPISIQSRKLALDSKENLSSSSGHKELTNSSSNKNWESQESATHQSFHCMKLSKFMVDWKDLSVKKICRTSLMISSTIRLNLASYQPYQLSRLCQM